MFSLPRGTEMFQFPRFPLLVLCVQTRVTPHDGCGVSPFGYPRIEARSAAPRGFSQPPTSFIGSRCQGIHRWLFIAWNLRTTDARARYGVLKVRVSPLGWPATAASRIGRLSSKGTTLRLAQAAARRPQQVEMKGLPLQNGTEGLGTIGDPQSEAIAPATAASRSWS